jgi:hypothetical protein
MCHYPDRDNPLTVAAPVQDDDDAHECHVHAGLEGDAGDAGSEAVPDERVDERVAPKALASDRKHRHGLLSEPSRFLESWCVMASLRLPLPDSVEEPYLSKARFQHD